MSCKISQSELLIECVRKHVILYDTNTKEYSDAHLKTKIWEEIAKECGFSTGNQAKNCWKNLRDGYRCSLKTAKSFKSGDAAKKTKPWKFTDQMSFLIPYMKDRPRSSNIACDSETASQLNETQIEVYADGNESVHEGSSDKEDHNVEQVSQLNETPSTSAERPLKRKVIEQQTHQSVARRKKRLAGTKDDPMEFLREQARKREERSEARQQARNELLQSPRDSLKLFFDSMYEATKILPLLQQRQVRRALFNAVSAAEDSADNQSVGTATPTVFSVIDSDETRVSVDFIPNYQTTSEHQANYNMITDNNDYNITDIVQNFSHP